VEGASAGLRFVVGAVIAVVGAYFGQTWAVNIGVGLMVGSVIEMLTPKPKMPDTSERKDKTSYYFDGPVNTTAQGVPVPLIYGHNVRVGSHAISAQVTVDQLV
jgi:predicted phage tail protein